MCVSSQTSLVLFVSGCVGSLTLLYNTRNLKYLSILFTILMQLGEYLMWTDIESGGKYPNLNIIGNYIGILSLFLQTSGLSIIMPKKYGLFIIIPNALYYSFITVLYTKKLLKNKNDALSKVGKSNTLSWASFLYPLSWLCLTLFIVSVIYNNIFYAFDSHIFHFKNYLHILFHLFLIITSMKFIHSPQVYNFGSLYCFFGAIVICLFVIYELFQHHFK